MDKAGVTDNCSRKSNSNMSYERCKLIETEGRDDYNIEVCRWGIKTLLVCPINNRLCSLSCSNIDTINPGTIKLLCNNKIFVILR